MEHPRGQSAPSVGAIAPQFTLPDEHNHLQHAEHGHIPYPVTFIVKPDGTMAWQFLGLQPRDRPKAEDVIQALDTIMVNAQ